MTGANQNPLVIVGMSGGVDSSVAALLLQQQGYRVQGLFMKNWEDDDTDRHCAAEEDARDAKLVCEELEIPLHRANFSRQYRERVFADFLAEYRAGRTPNPDVFCNQEIKFGAFLDHARRLGADWIATGHYARTRTAADDRRELLTGVDPDKDQSYFLYRLDQGQLAGALFPLGHLRKIEVRGIAERSGLHNFDRKDSTGICFIGERRFREFLGRYLEQRSGPIRDPDGALLGEHTGLCFYTLGQRQGLGIGGTAGSSGAPWYVAEKRTDSNTLIVVQGSEHPLLYRHVVHALRPHWISGRPPPPQTRLRARLRHRQRLQECVLTAADQASCEVTFPRCQRAVTPGQSVVLYQGETCLGGAIVDSLAR